MDAQTILVLSILGALLLTCMLFILAALIYRTMKATIAGFSWVRKIDFEHYVWVEESSLYGFPDGSRNQRSQLESYQSYEHVRTETITTTENGQTTTTTRPVYEYVTRWRTRYDYEIERWVISRSLHTEGNERTTRHWPAYQLDWRTHERIKAQQEKYLVFFQTVRGKQYKQKLPENDWASLDEQATYTLKVNFFGRVKEALPKQQQIVTMIKQGP